MGLLKRHSATHAAAPGRKVARKTAAIRSPTQMRIGAAPKPANPTSTTRAEPSSKRTTRSKAKMMQVEGQPNDTAEPTETETETEQPQQEQQPEPQPQPQPQEQQADHTSCVSPSTPTEPRPESAASTSSSMSMSSEGIVNNSSSESASVDAVPVFSAEELKMLQTISSVTDRIAQLEHELPTLRAQISHHTSRLVLMRWNKKYRSPTLNPTSVNLSHKRLHYAAGGVDENVMQSIFRLDSIQTDNKSIRATRKATVSRANKLIAESVKLREKMDRWKRWLPEEPKQEPEPVVAPAQPAPKALESTKQSLIKQAAVEEKKEEVAMMEDEANDSDTEMEEKHSEPVVASLPTHMRRASPPAPASPPKSPPAKLASAPKVAPVLNPLQRKYAHLNLPAYAGPSFHSRVHPLTGSLLIEADMSGVVSEDVSVSTDPSTRSLIIRGVKLPQRRRSIPAHPFGGFFAMPPQPVEPHGYFSKTICFADIDPSETLNLAAMSAVLNADERLEITIPRIAPPKPKRVPQPTPAQLYHRHPVQHSTRATYSDEEEEQDAADSYSHPYASYYQPHPHMHHPYKQPRAVPRGYYGAQYPPQAYARPSPFGSWW